MDPQQPMTFKQWQSIAGDLLVQARKDGNIQDEQAIATIFYFISVNAAIAWSHRFAAIEKPQVEERVES